MGFEISDLLKEIREEITVASQAFFAWKSIHNVASNDKNIEKAINENALSWNICLHSLQTTFFITIGRIFDIDLRTCSIHLLFRQSKKNIEKFSKTCLKQRRIDDANGIVPDYLDSYIEDAYEATIDDLMWLEGNVSRVQKIYEGTFKPARNKIFAHKDSGYIFNSANLFVGVTIDDAEEILNTLYKVEKVISNFYVNGKKMDYEYWKSQEEEYILKDIESLLNKI